MTPRLALRAAALLGLLVVVAACGTAKDELGGQRLDFERPETTVEYTVELEGVTDEEMASLMEQSFGLYRHQAGGAQSIAFLRRRAQGDIEIAQKILRSYGYYEAEVKTKVEVVRADNAHQGGQTGAPAGTQAAATHHGQMRHAVARVIVTPGRPFILVSHRFLVIDHGEGAAPEMPSAKDLGSPVGEPAAAQPIVAAEAKAVAALRKAGRPYAEARGRRAVADMEKAELEVETTIASGPFYRYGEVRYEGLENVDESYVRTYQTWKEGAPADARKLREYQRELMGTELFNVGSARFPDDPPEGDTAPVIVTLEEGPPRRVTAGLAYSTDLGPEGNASYTHRNLFGSNETFDAVVSLGLTEQRLTLGYTEPQWKRPGQDLVFGAEARHVEDDAYDETAFTFTGGIQRTINKYLTVGVGGLAEVSKVTDQGVTQNVLLGGIPGVAFYDDTDDTLNPTEGIKATLFATPFLGSIDGDVAPFFTIDGRGSTYYDILDDGRYVLAGRARLGSILSGDVSDIPAPRRLYSGGGGSVRGYADKMVGPLDSSGDPIGGRSALELSGEFRAKVWGDVGVVGFVDSGAVSEAMYPNFADGMQVAAGFGARYYSPVGPLRFDFAVPLNPRETDDAFQFYIAIGQAY